MKLFKILAIAIAVVASVNFMAPPAMAYDGDYDAKVIRAYKKAKFKKIRTKIQLQKDFTDEELRTAVADYLRDKRYFQRKIRRQPEVVLVSLKQTKRKAKISKIYHFKRPERFLISLDKNTEKALLKDRAAIADYITAELTPQAIVSEKIDNKNKFPLLKVIDGTYNGTLGLFTAIPKFGLGRIINPPFQWLKTNTPEDNYNRILDQSEKIALNKKGDIYAVVLEGEDIREERKLKKIKEDTSE